MKLLEENIGRTNFDINCSSISLYLSLKAKEIKAKINKWDLIKLKSVYTAKETIDRMKRKPTKWEKIFTNDVTGKRLIYKIHTPLTQLSLKKKHSSLNLLSLITILFPLFAFSSRNH